MGRPMMARFADDPPCFVCFHALCVGEVVAAVTLATVLFQPL